MEIVLKYFPDITQHQIAQYRSLEPLYKEWNDQINIISRKDIDRLYERHILHSLSIAKIFDFEKGTEILDLGTGGGFPGIPLAIFFPHVKFHLIDSIAKKLKVVEKIAGSIDLKNITTQHIRVENIKKENREHRGSGFDFVVSRAVAPLKDLWKWSRPLLKLSDENSPTNPTTHTKKALPVQFQFGGLICLKGGDLAEEISESRTRPLLVEIKDLFDEEFFTDKCILYLPCK
jgi:16S rRNA (guanine527-N7)-methyltransferase